MKTATLEKNIKLSLQERLALHDKEFFSINDCTNLLQVSRGVITRLIQKKQMKFVWISRRKKITKDNLITYLNNMCSTATPPS